MDAYCKAVRRLEDKFDGLDLNHVLRKFNETTDALANMASEWATVPSDVFVSDLHKPSIDYKEDGGSDHTSTDPAPSSETPRLPSRRPWTSNLRCPHQTTYPTGVTLSCSASSTGPYPEMKPKHGD